MYRSIGLIGAVTMLATHVPAQDNSLRICVVQPTQIYRGYKMSGRFLDAWKLAPELANRPLANGQPIVAVAVTGKSREVAEAAATRQRCSYVVELWRRESTDPVAPDGVPGVINPGDQITAMGDKDGIVYQMRKFDAQKILLRGFAPVVTRHGRSAIVFTPYPLFADQILKKLNKLEP